MDSAHPVETEHCGRLLTSAECAIGLSDWPCEFGPMNKRFGQPSPQGL